MKKTIVISAVNIRKGGTLTILRDCLSYLSTIADQYRIVAIVHRKELCDYPGIEYIEMPDTIKGWGKRLKAEYLTFNKISKQLAPVYLWFSLHDTTPRVQAEHQAVYCQTSFPFMRAKLQDFRFDPKIVLFTLFTRFAYRFNVHRNDYLVVQTQWLREGLSKMLNVDKNRFIVAPPKVNVPAYDHGTMVQPPVFIYPATPDCHKNFETLCEAASLLEESMKVADSTDDAVAKAECFKSSVLAHMDELRCAVDAMECLVGVEKWPYPAYGDILYSVR